MSTITQIRLWYDTGFTEGCTEVPRINGSLPTPSLTYDASFTPSTSDIFSRLKLRVPYTTLMNCSYLAISLDMNNGTDKVFYGWIDKVNIISDTESNPLTEILWHVDLWRTYISSVTVGSGMVNRRPLLTNDSVPPQSYPYRSEMVNGSPIYFGDWDGLVAQDRWSVIFTFNYNYKSYTTNEDGSQTIDINYTASGVGTFPVSRANPQTRQGVDSYTAPSLFEVVNGQWDELIGLDPDSIKGVFIVPGTNLVSGYLISAYKITQPEAAACGFYKADGMTFGTLGSLAMTLPTTVMTDDINTYYITGFDGEVIGALPWGIPVDSLYYMLIIDSSAAYLQIRAGGEDAHIEGTCFTIPLPTLELSSNAWSSYVYSGARYTDIVQKGLEASQTREAARISTVSNAISSATSVGSVGLLGGPVGAILGGIIGGVSSAVTSTYEANENYLLTSRYNDIFQKVEDYRTAHQTNGLLISGSGFTCLATGRRPALFKATKDDYSVQQRANDISLYGVHVSEPRSSCQSLIAAGGPVQITNAVVTGSVPVEAKQYIRQRLAQGVRMI